MDYLERHVERGADRIGTHLYPAGRADSAAVVIWPAMGVPARYYRPFAADLAATGFTVAVADLRGAGASTPRPSRAARYGYADLVDDVAAVHEALRPDLDGRRVVLLGHSLGGQVCALRLAAGVAGIAGAADVAGLVLVGVGPPYWRSYPARRRLGVLGVTQTIAAASGVLGVWPGWGFGGRQARGVMRDWAYTARRGSFPPVHGVDMEAALAAVTTPVLAVTVEGDDYTPVSTVEHMCAKLGAAPVERYHYTTGTAGARLDHFKWVRAGGPLAAKVAEFAGRL